MDKIKIIYILIVEMDLRWIVDDLHLLCLWIDHYRHTCVGMGVIRWDLLQWILGHHLQTCGLHRHLHTWVDTRPLIGHLLHTWGAHPLLLVTWTGVHRPHSITGLLLHTGWVLCHPEVLHHLTATADILPAWIGHTETTLLLLHHHHTSGQVC